MLHYFFFCNKFNELQFKANSLRLINRLHNKSKLNISFRNKN